MTRLPFLSADQVPSLSETKVRTISPAALAYLGDAVYELFVRTQCLLPPCRIRTYHQRVVSSVRAEAQANYAQALQPLLTEAEQAVLKQGRNSASGGPKRIELGVYQQATGLETLIGYLYLTNPQRLEELLGHLDVDQVATH